MRSIRRRWSSCASVAPESDSAAQRARLLASGTPPVMAVLEGGLANPRLTGGVQADGITIRQLRFLVADARRAQAAPAAARRTSN